MHPHADKVVHEVDGYFLHHGRFPNARAKQRFLAAGFSSVVCLYFPLAKNNRIHFACRLLTIFFSVDDFLEEMSFSEGEAYNKKLMRLAAGTTLPDRTVPAEFIFHKLWEGMRARDEELADKILEPMFTFMRAQTDQVRREIVDLRQYLEYREKDVGKSLLSTLMRQVAIVNDICSWEKELRSSRALHQEGAVLCSAVKVLADTTQLGIDASKRVLWAMVREWEGVHEEMAAVLAEEVVRMLSGSMSRDWSV
ncbi:putative aristolochene synthase protein [Aspergillus mulundensis]|uniref:Putative aristolochene synthase protein n=1 Tax=Aspergillus mulundensis TaxID=1810919 RepID=A0A3D8R9X6_9EURO|nr:putative aristolochene synthase protein [Aspergillus mulundensis]RDW70664.1 putative aristolochene synthase protein [Aspergillus mulundensis]